MYHNGMYISREEVSFYQRNKLFLSCRYTSKEDFVRKYLTEKRLNHEMEKAKDLYLLILTELEKTISEGKTDSFIELSNLVDYINDVEDQITLKDYYDNPSNPIRNTNLVILACKHNRVKILEYLFESGSRILNNLSISVRRTTVLPDDADESHHNAFYYAVRSENIDLLDVLIDKWPTNHFAARLGELDEILSRAYEDLKLKNVPLSDEMEIFVENKLMDLRFFSNASGQNQNLRDELNSTQDRIKLLFQNINLLNADYSNTEEVDEKFLFVAKSIAQNIHVLKRYVKSTYDRLPWEEVEFCLIIFISSHTKQQESNLFYHVTLNKRKILDYLKSFAKKLEDEKDIVIGENSSKPNRLPRLNRDKVVENIIKSHPEFEELYKDYREIRDIYSLEKISGYMKLASMADPKERKGQLIIARAFQVIGEHFKNTLESPKLSKTISDLLLQTLQKNARKIIMDLRDSLSHVNSLSKRIQMEGNTDVEFFPNIQNDIKKVAEVIIDILYNNKIKAIRMLLKKFITSEDSEEMKEVAEVLSSVELDKIISGNFRMMEHGKLERMVELLKANTPDQTDYEKELFAEINEIINAATQSENIKSSDYRSVFVLLKLTSLAITNIHKTDQNSFQALKLYAKSELQSITPKLEFRGFKKISQLAQKIAISVWSRLPLDQNLQLSSVISKIFCITAFRTGDIKWVEELQEKLAEKRSSGLTRKQRKTVQIPEENYDNYYEPKLQELKSILSDNSLIDSSNKNFPFYKTDKQLQTVVEMLVLDIMSILGSSKEYLEHNDIFIDDYSPLLNGKCLRNYLAHDNAVVDVLLSDPCTAIMLNAKKLTEENILISKKKIGKVISDDPSKLREKYDQRLATITNQKKMFVALEEGNLEGLIDCLKEGADINARSVHLWTTLHFAAKGPNLEVLKFLLDQNLSANVKDVNGESPLHIAAKYGRKHVVEFFIKEAGIYVDDLNNRGKTPLHLAAQNGNEDAAKVLLKNNANPFTQDMLRILPLHYAMWNNNTGVAKLLLKNQDDGDLNEFMCSFTPLHLAAESCNLELVNFLIQNKADVNARNYKNCLPLHLAAYNGHLEIVNALILGGANVNAVVLLDGCTPLHYAIEKGREKIVDILLKNGANINAVEKNNAYTPLHYAAKFGHTGIVMALLEYKASVNVANVKGMTALHFAVKAGHFDIVDALLKVNADLCAEDKDNSGPLHYAAESGHKEIAELLIAKGIEFNARDKNNLTPLHIAAWKGHQDVVDLLIQHKAKVNAQDANGETPLQAAAVTGNTSIFDVLIKNGAKVNARSNNGMTPLHAAAMNSCIDAVDFLIKNNAEVNAQADHGFTPLQAAIVKGHKDVVSLLIVKGALVNERGLQDKTPLYIAVEGGLKEIVEILATNGASVNMKCHNETPLYLAVTFNHKEVVEVLIAKGANVNAEGTKSELLSKAILIESTDILDILLKNKACVNGNSIENSTPLHWAANLGHKKMVNSLVTAGANINAVTVKNETPLYLAAQEGHAEIVEILIAHGADVNFKTTQDYTPLHTAVTNGHSNAVKVLLDNEAKANVRDNENRTPIELAVARSHLEAVKMLLKCQEVHIEAKGNGDHTILLIASQWSNSQMVKYLVSEGANINATNAFGLKPIHIAAREGYKDTVEFLLSKGFDINEPGPVNNFTLLHFAVMRDSLQVVNYLIEQRFDVNAKTADGLTPMHVAANYGHKSNIEVLLKNGAVYNIGAMHSFDKKPIELAEDLDIIKLLGSTEKLLEAVKHNNPSKVENFIKAGAFVNAINADGETPLHHAAWKGYDEVVNILLQSKADPNIVRNKGLRPLHYAAKFSHMKIVKALLSNHAVYNAATDSGKTPLDFAVNEDISGLLKLVSDTFESIKNGNCAVVDDLSNIKDIDTVKAIMNACNRENKTLVVAAVHSNFPQVEQLKQIAQGDIFVQINEALVLLNQDKYSKALNIFKGAYEKRKDILGSDNPGTLDIRVQIATVLFKQGYYQEALNLLEDIFQKQTEILRLKDENTISTRRKIALVLRRLGKYEEAFKIDMEVYQMQKETLGPDHSDTLFRKTLILENQGKYEEALNINKAIFEKRKEVFDVNDPTAVNAQDNIAMLLSSQGNYEKALKMYKEVIEKKKAMLGTNHSETLRTLYKIAGVLLNQKKYHEALKTYQEVLNVQKKVLGRNHPDTLDTQYGIGTVLYGQTQFIGVLKAYMKCYVQMEAVFGPNHRSVLNISQKLGKINSKFEREGSNISEVIQHLKKEIHIASSNGDIQTVQRLLTKGAVANDEDLDGTTPLYYAVSNGHVDVVNILLINGADVTQVTNKGYTPLHTASFKGNGEIVDVLLQHVNPDTLNDYINAKIIASGATSLHLAVNNGFLDVTKSLLKKGASYNVRDKDGKTPLQLSIKYGVTDLLKLIEKSFEEVKKGNEEIIGKLRAVSPDVRIAVTNACNDQGNTLRQVAIANGHEDVASKLLEMLKEVD